MARPITPGDEIPTSPPLRVLAVGKRVDGWLEVTVDLPADHPDYAALTAGTLGNVSLAEPTGLIGHPGHPDEDTDAERAYEALLSRRYADDEDV